jgi:hypothetical protein
VWNGTQRLNVSNILAYGVADINFSNAVVIPANSSVTLSVKVNVDSDGGAAPAGSQFALTVNEVKNAATSTLIPATSGILTVSNVELGTLTVGISGDAPTSNLDVGSEGVALAKFDFATAREDQLLKQVSFSQNGSASDGDVTNLKLFNQSGVDVGGTAIRNGRNVAFTFGDGLAIENGATLRLELRGDVVGGSGRNLQFGVDDDTDVQSIGKTYGTTIVSTWGTGNSEGNKLEINPGNFIVSRAETSPVAGDIGDTFKENVFTILKVEAIGEPIQVRSVVINAAAAGTADLAGLTNLKLIYNGSTIAQVVTPTWVAGAAGSHDVKVTLTAPITLSPGTPAYISIAADSVGTLTHGETFILGLSGVKDAIYGLGTVSAKTVGTDASSASLGNVMTVGDVEVTVTAVPRGGTSIFAGQVSAELASFTLDHNLSETVSVTKLGINNTFAAGVFTNFAIYDDKGVAISDKIVSVPTGALSFNLKTPLKIDADASVKVVLKADVSSNATGSGGFGIISTGTNGSFALTTALGNEINVVGATASTIYTVVDGSLIKILAAESSAINLEEYINAPQGAVQVPVAAFKLSNADVSFGFAGYGLEPVLVKKIYLKSSFGEVDGSFAGTGPLGSSGIKNITIINNYDKSILGKVEYLEGGTGVTLTTPLYLGNSDATRNADIVVLADVVSTARRGGTYQIQLGTNIASSADIEYQTQTTGKSGSTALGAGTALAGSTLVVVPTTVTVTSNTTGNVTNTSGQPATGNTLASFTFTNHGSTAVVIDQLHLANGLGGTTWNGKIVELVKGSTVLTAADIDLTTGVAILTSNATATQLRIEANSSTTITVRLKNGSGGTPFPADSAIALKVVRGDQTNKTIATGDGPATTFKIPNDAETSYLIEDDVVSNTVYFIQN